MAEIDIPVYTLKKAIDSLPSASEWIKDKSVRTFEAIVNAELMDAQLKDSHVFFRVKMNRYRFVFNPEISLIENGKVVSYDWSLVSYELITME